MIEDETPEQKRRERPEEELNRDKKVVEAVAKECGLDPKLVEQRQQDRREMDYDTYRDATREGDYSAAELECAVDKVRSNYPAATQKVDACVLKIDFLAMGGCSSDPTRDSECARGASILLPKLGFDNDFDTPEIATALTQCRQELFPSSTGVKSNAEDPAKGK